MKRSTHVTLLVTGSVAVGSVAYMAMEGSKETPPAGEDMGFFECLDRYGEAICKDKAAQAALIHNKEAPRYLSSDECKEKTGADCLDNRLTAMLDKPLPAQDQQTTQQRTGGHGVVFVNWYQPYYTALNARPSFSPPFSGRWRDMGRMARVQPLYRGPSAGMGSTALARVPAGASVPAVRAPGSSPAPSVVARAPTTSVPRSGVSTGGFGGAARSFSAPSSGG